MTRLELDGGEMQSLADLHEQIAKHPNCPGYYGRNLDALWDVVTGHLDSPVEIVWLRSEQARSNLGADFTRVESLFLEAAEHAGSRGEQITLVLQESPPPLAGEDL